VSVSARSLDPNILVAGWRLGSLPAPMVLDGPKNGTPFLTYTEQILRPALKLEIS
jgi:hypothetical protein